MSKIDDALRLKISGLCGFLTPLVAFALIFLAIASYPEFSWGDNALSDLGIVEGVTAVLFNSGLLVGGFLCFVFATGLFVFLKVHFFGKIGVFIFVLASLALFAIGVFPEDVRPVHYIVSVMFFVFLPFSMMVIAGAFWLMRKMRMAVFTLVVALAAAAPWVLYFAFHYVSNVAVPEIVSAFAGSVWAVVLSGKMLKQASRSEAS
ncbi:MAG: DUF998 domain-containing protein [Candidatus Bathyarchaeota archaeon]|nr:DUF998 domain-containing protein [Candidatus Bathyarchaeota archaeon]